MSAWKWERQPTPEAQLAAGCGDGHDPASATGVCTRCGYDVMGYYAGWDADEDDTRPCDACGADLSEPCRPWCIGDAARAES